VGRTRCTVRDGEYSLVVEADSLYRVMHSYNVHAVRSYPDAAGIPAPDMDAPLEVTVEGHPAPYRRAMRQAWDWANRFADERCRVERYFGCQTAPESAAPSTISSHALVVAQPIVLTVASLSRLW
jgi:hypothetical protein